MQSKPVTAPPAPRFSLIIPAHNEAERIGKTVRDYLDHFEDSEVILVVNGCTDNTEAVAYAAAANRPNMRLVHINHSVGKGGAIRAGFLSARAKIVGFVDADGATSAAEIRRLFELVTPGVDAVIASRWIRGAKVDVLQPFIRRLASRTFNAIVRIAFALPFTDTQCGAKVFRAEALHEIANSLEVSNFAFDVDLLFALRRTGRKLVEVPTVWRDVEGSKIGNIPHASRTMLLAIARLRIRYSLFRYVIPFFDRVFDTSHLRIRHGLSILILNWRDPKHPQAGGAEKYLFEIAKRFSERGHHVQWISAGFPGGERTDVLEGIKIRRVGNKFTVYALIPITYLRSFRDRFDAVIDAENGIPFFSPFYSLKPKLCLIFHVHQRIFEKHLPVPISTFFKWIEARVMPLVYKNSRFVSISKDTTEDLVALGIARDGIDVAYAGIDPGLKPSEKSDRPTILYLGRLKAYKRVEILIEDLPIVLRTLPDVELIIAGTGDYEQNLRAIARRLGVERHVSFEGFVTEDRKRYLMGRAWIFAMPSEMEGWGLTIIEANACGTACVGYDVPGVGEAIAHEKSGLTVPTGERLGPTLAALLADSDRLRKLEVGALVRAKEFSWDSTADKFLDVIVSEIAKTQTSYIKLGDSWAVVPHAVMNSKTTMMRHEFENRELLDRT